MAGRAPSETTGSSAGDAAELARLAEDPELGPDAAVSILRHPHCDRAVLEILLENRKLHLQYEFRLEFAGHPKAPTIAAINFLRTLYWRDQYELAREPRTAPFLRRNAMSMLVERIPDMTLGERITLARIAGVEMIPALSRTGEPQVLAALLDNPRMREGQVVTLIEDPGAPVSLIERVARHHKWAYAYRVRALLVRDPRLKDQAALRLMKGMPDSELDKVAADPRSGRLRAEAARRKKVASRE